MWTGAADDDDDDDDDDDNNIYRGYHQANTKLIRVVLYLHYYTLLYGIKTWSLKI